MARELKKKHFRAACALLILLLSLTAVASAQADATSRSWNQPVKPFRLIANIHYVGASDVTSYLITTPEGHILLDGGFAETAPQIRSNIEALGFRLADVKILLNGHAHSDHAGGLAQLKAATGAQMMASEAEASLLERGGRQDFAFGDGMTFPAVKVDRRLKDSERIELGGVVMIPLITPGHTRGNTTWTMQVTEGSRRLEVVFVGSTSAPGYRLSGNKAYPEIIEDYRRTFERLKKLPCDVFLAPHGSFFDLKGKMGRRDPAVNPFIDPQGYRDWVARNEREFLSLLARENNKPPQKR